MPSLEGVDPNLVAAYDKLAQVCNISVSSGHRADEKTSPGDGSQQDLYDRWKGGESGIYMPAVPKVYGGKGSPHTAGVALDIDGDLVCAHRNASLFGLHFPYGSNDPPHMELAGGSDHVAPEFVDRDGSPVAAPVTQNPLPGILAAVTNALGGTNASSVTSLGEDLGKKPVIEAASTERPPNSVTGGETGEGGDADSWIREAMRITGVPEDWYAGLHRRMMQESGGQNIPQGIVDINTQKGTPAFGPMQVIEPTFRAHALPGYENWHDPLHSTIAAIRYIAGRYGHPDKLPRGGY